MAKLHFRYGAMGSSKTAQALMMRFNYMEKGRKVWLIKPSIDTRDGLDIIQSRIGLKAAADVIHTNDDILKKYLERKEVRCAPDVIIADECQFFSPEHISQLRHIVSYYDVPVICFGLRTDFQCKLFPGSKALFELADEIEEIKSICKCGAKATVNARVDKNGDVVTNGRRIELGGNDKYVSMCWKCYNESVTNKSSL